MDNIQRYNLFFSKRDHTYPYGDKSKEDKEYFYSLKPSKKGEWVKYEDIKHLLKLNEVEE
jgi:hypothetical protein